MVEGAEVIDPQVARLFLANQTFANAIALNTDQVCNVDCRTSTRCRRTEGYAETDDAAAGDPLIGPTLRTSS